jgi:hypothetical protein
MGLTRQETETVINFNDAEDDAWIATRQKRVKSMMRKRGIKPFRTQGDYECYLVPKRWVKVSPPRRVSETQRKIARERFKKLQARKRVSKSG